MQIPPLVLIQAKLHLHDTVGIRERESRQAINKKSRLT